MSDLSVSEGFLPKGDFMIPTWLKIILLIARTINPQINRNQEFSITLEELDALRQMPNGTLGREYVRFLDNHSFTPFNTGDLIQRHHDVWHVLIGFDSSPHDEFMLQIFTRAQVFRPTSAIVVLAGLLTGMCNFQEIRQVLKMGKQAKSLIDWDVKSDWETPLVEVRKKLNVIPLDELKKGVDNTQKNVVSQRPLQEVNR